VNPRIGEVALRLGVSRQRVHAWLEAPLAHVIVDGVLWRTVPSTLPTKDRARLRVAS
jgi:hypothetical protein